MAYFPLYFSEIPLYLQNGWPLAKYAQKTMTCFGVAIEVYTDTQPCAKEQNSSYK